MGSSSSKKKPNNGPKEEPNLPYKVETKPTNPLSPQSPQLPAVSSSRASGRNETVSLHSRVSIKRSITNLPNGIEHLSTSRAIDDDDDVSLPPIDNPVKKRGSRSSARISGVARSPPINRPRPDVDSFSETSKCSHRKISGALDGPIGRCPYCRHCQHMGDVSTRSTPKLKWLTENPEIGVGDTHIDMDKYDIEAVKKKIIEENGHLPGSYDYKPYLTIEQTDVDDQTKENYYTQPVVAKTQPRILPACTPFPEYDLLQRREQRLNKPYTISLFN